ncbi:putative Cytochrome P450 [Seiridium cardinale]|uniref:Cytochrome P450 n=1 Tax=Seiridium cardinale TaxID=138064 RepID=A0ABR2XBU6_9PEZI
MTTDLKAIQDMAQTRPITHLRPFNWTWKPTKGLHASQNSQIYKLYGSQQRILSCNEMNAEQVEACAKRQCAQTIGLLKRSHLSEDDNYFHDMDEMARETIQVMISNLCRLDEYDFMREPSGWNCKSRRVKAIVNYARSYVQWPRNSINHQTQVQDGVENGDIEPTSERQQIRDTKTIFTNCYSNSKTQIHELVLRLFASINPCAITIRKIMAHIVVTPPLYSKLRLEIDNTAIETDSSQLGSTNRRLPYLNAVVREGLRLFPLDTVPFFRVPRGGTTISGYDVPEGTQVGLNLLGILRSKEHWGLDAGIFKPERWIEATPVAREKMNQAWMSQWRVGDAAPLLQSMVQMMITEVISEILRQFDFSIVTPHNPVMLMDSNFLESNFQVRLTPRLNNENHTATQ